MSAAVIQRLGQFILLAGSNPGPGSTSADSFQTTLLNFNPVCYSSATDPGCAGALLPLPLCRRESAAAGTDSQRIVMTQGPLSRRKCCPASAEKGKSRGSSPRASPPFPPFSAAGGCRDSLPRLHRGMFHATSLQGACTPNEKVVSQTPATCRDCPRTRIRTTGAAALASPACAAARRAPAPVAARAYFRTAFQKVRSALAACAFSVLIPHGNLSIGRPV